jgi:hypothetical protein
MFLQCRCCCSCPGGCSESAVAVAGSCTPICWNRRSSGTGPQVEQAIAPSVVTIATRATPASPVPSRCCDPDMAPPPAARNLKMGQGSGSSANLGLIGVCSAYTHPQLPPLPQLPLFHHGDAFSAAASLRWLPKFMRTKRASQHWLIYISTDMRSEDVYILE